MNQTATLIPEQRFLPALSAVMTVHACRRILQVSAGTDYARAWKPVLIVLMIAAFVTGIAMTSFALEMRPAQTARMIAEHARNNAPILTSEITYMLKGSSPLKAGINMMNAGAVENKLLNMCVPVRPLER